MHDGHECSLIQASRLRRVLLSDVTAPADENKQIIAVSGSKLNIWGFARTDLHTVCQIKPSLPAAYTTRMSLTASSRGEDLIT